MGQLYAGYFLMVGSTAAGHRTLGWRGEDASGSALQRRLDQEVQVFDSFLDLFEGREDFALFHYGSYERKLLRRMRKVVKRATVRSES